MSSRSKVFACKACLVGVIRNIEERSMSFYLRATKFSLSPISRENFKFPTSMRVYCTSTITSLLTLNIYSLLYPIQTILAGWMHSIYDLYLLIKHSTSHTSKLIEFRYYSVLSLSSIVSSRCCKIVEIFTWIILMASFILYEAFSSK